VLSADDPRTAPFDLGQGSPPVLLLHGFTGTPFEMRFLGERLAARGFRAAGPRLPGHGTSAEALEQSSAMDWLNEARAALFDLAQTGPVFVAGLSMGALLGALLAAEHRDKVAGLALCAPALSLGPLADAFLWAAAGGLLPARLRFLEKRKTDLADLEMRDQNPCLDRIPIRAAGELARVQTLARLALPRVRAPSLVIYSESDRIVPASAAREAAEKLGSPPRVVRLLRSSHVVTLDLEREAVADHVAGFFRALC
jgi:carboxylesterase